MSPSGELTTVRFGDSYSLCIIGGLLFLYTIVNNINANQKTNGRTSHRGNTRPAQNLVPNTFLFCGADTVFQISASSVEDSGRLVRLEHRKHAFCHARL